MFDCILRPIRGWLSDDPPQEVIGESLWVFILSKNPFAIFLGLGTVVLQIMILQVFAFNTETAYFEPNCDDEGNLSCQEWSFTSQTTTMVLVILLCWTVSDIFAGLQIIISVFVLSPLATKKATRYMGVRLRLLLLGAVSLTIGNITLFFAYFNVIQTSTSDLGAILNVVGILYVMDLDEAVFSSFKNFAPHFHKRIMKGINDEFTTGLNGKEPGEEEDDTMVSPPQASFPPPGSASIATARNSTIQSEQARTASVTRGRGAASAAPSINSSNTNPALRASSLERGRNPSLEPGVRNPSMERGRTSFQQQQQGQPQRSFSQDQYRSAVNPMAQQQQQQRGSSLGPPQRNFPPSDEPELPPPNAAYTGGNSLNNASYTGGNGANDGVGDMGYI